MLQKRIIPCLLLKDKGLVKTIGFENPRYIGDPINAVRIFNQKNADEIIFLNISRSKIEHQRNWQLVNDSQTIDLISKISDECFMPLGYGGGIRSIEDIKELFKAGVEKVSINTSAVECPSLIREASRIFGSQSITVSIDVKINKRNVYEVFIYGGTKGSGKDPISHATNMESLGAGEIIINSIDNDGIMQGYDIELIKSISRSVKIPVIACGGCGNLNDFTKAILEGGASAVAAGSFFVFHGKKRAVLINYPNNEERKIVCDTTWRY
jgi:imidazole glycerol-phosphate synthase subunit HisF